MYYNFNSALSVVFIIPIFVLIPDQPFMQLRTGLFVIALMAALLVSAQAPILSSESRISVITCGPGDELYTAFGHSAYRVQDSTLGIDVIYNYGTFDFNAPNFYMNFARGKLMYALSRQRFADFLYNYQLENRWVKEQILELTTTEKNDLFQFLETNYLPENREYLYDFLFNNCATKIPEVMQLALGPSLEFGDDHLEETYTYRELIHQYLYTNSWASLGIDLALGAVVDKDASVYDHMFIPDYVYLQMQNTQLDQINVLARERSILDIPELEENRLFTTSPLFWFLVLFLFTAAFTIIDFRNGVRSRYLDFGLFLAAGLVGLLIFFLWFLTNHTSTAFNLNILWAVPVHLVVAFMLLRNSPPNWVYIYLQVSLGLIGLCLICWIFGIQVFSPLVIILWVILALRMVFLLRHLQRS